MQRVEQKKILWIVLIIVPSTQLVQLILAPFAPPSKPNLPCLTPSRISNDGLKCH